MFQYHKNTRTQIHLVPNSRQDKKEGGSVAASQHLLKNMGVKADIYWLYTKVVKPKITY